MIFAVVVGMAVGAGQFLVPMIGVPVVGATALVLHHWSGHSNGSRANGTAGFDVSLTVRLGLGRAPDVLLGDVLLRHADRYQVLSAATARQGAALDVSYSIRLTSEASMTALVTELNQIEGVQSVELCRPRETGAE